MKFSSRLEQISPSRTLQVMLDLAELRSKGLDIIDLGPGEPDFEVPGTAREGGIRSIRDGLTGYTAAAGLVELRQAVADRYNQKYSTDLDASNVTITCGAKQAIYNTCLSVFENGDEVLVPVPYWVTFPEAIKLSGATPREVFSRFEDGFIPSLTEIEKKVTSSTRGLIVNSPNNPTGAVIPKNLISELVDLSKSEEIFLLFDETYDFFTYGVNKHHSLVSFTSKNNPNFAVIGSFSKSFAMTGWRLGYCIGSPELIRHMNALQSHTTGNACTISQRAALDLLSREEDVDSQQKLTTFSERRQFVLSALSEIPGFVCRPPDGAFYAFPKVEECMKRLGLTDSTTFSRFLLHEAHVATVPGDAFGLDGYIRLSYATSMENLKEGLQKIHNTVTK